MTEVLKTAKEALDKGLISKEEYDGVKGAFLKAQQIKAGLDAGFILEQDYDQVKTAFLQSLNLSSDGTVEVKLPAATNVANGYARGLEVQPKDSTAAVQGQTTQSEVRSARTVIPTNIPKMGGSRRKQTGGTSMSGIEVRDEAVDLYYFLKAKSTYRWATWRINDEGNAVVIGEAGEKDSTYSDLLDTLPPKDCRYAVFDHQFTNSDGCVFNKLVFINWAPDSAKVKNKMMYASTKDFFKSFLDGLGVEMQASEKDDIRESDMANAVLSTITRS